MKKYIEMGLLSLLIVSFFSACEHMSDISNKGLLTNTVDADSLETSANEEEIVRNALKKDAHLARSMPLKQFARHMKKRHSYYKQFTTAYKDDFVAIVIEREKMRIETPKGKVKFEYSKEVK